MIAFLKSIREGWGELCPVEIDVSVFLQKLINVNLVCTTWLGPTRISADLSWTK